MLSHRLLPGFILFSVTKSTGFPQVGFESVILRLTDIVAGTGQAIVTRKGVYGSVVVSWMSGYSPDLVTDLAHPGNITPPFGKYLSEEKL